MGFKLPFMRNISDPAKKYIVNFGGLNLTDNFSEGELLESENLSTNRFPFLSVRRPFYHGAIDVASGRVLDQIWSDGNIFATAERARVGDTTVSYIKFRNYNEKDVAIPDLEAVGGSRYGTSIKSLDFVRINNKLTVFTDAGEEQINGAGLVAPYTINLDPEEKEHKWESTTCIGKGTAKLLKNAIIMDMESSWIGGYGEKCSFKVGDTVGIYLSDFVGSELLFADTPDFYGVVANEPMTGESVNPEFSGTVISFTTPIFEAFLEAEGYDEDKVYKTMRAKVEKATPSALEYPIGINNRIWATKGNKIYASALGEPSRWESFEGVSSDSYQVAVDSSGDFTGISVYESNPILFKENMVYRVYGSIPANFSLQKVDAPGVMYGSHRSIQKINEVLYYKGKKGIYRYAGGIPQCISEKLGDLSEYKNAVAGTDGRYYYVTMTKDDDNEKEFFVFDTETGLWLQNSRYSLSSFANWGGYLYAHENETRNIIAFEYDKEKNLTADLENSLNIQWKATFKPFNETVNDRKVYSRLYLRLELEELAWVSVYIKHDNKPWEEVQTIKGGEDVTTETIPIKLKKCDQFTVKLEGKGYCCVKSFVREYRTAGDR